MNDQSDVKKPNLIADEKITDEEQDDLIVTDMELPNEEEIAFDDKTGPITITDDDDVP